MKIIVSFSGGKDSQACLIYAVNKYGAENIEAVFCDTGWEHPETYKHIDNICKMMGVNLTVLKSKYDFVALAKHKKRFPSTKARFCTVELKVKPMIDYVLSLNDSCIIIQGIRGKESFARSQMNAECMYFKEYFTPRVDKKGKKVYSTYRKSDVVEYCKIHDASVHRPLFEWTSQDVIDCILKAEQRPNPLYYRGYSRVGCFPCIMCRKSEMLNLMNDIDMKQRLIDAENNVGRSFFPPDYIPKYACSNGYYPSVQDVFKYVSDKNATLDMFEPSEGYACMSMFHGLCE